MARRLKPNVRCGPSGAPIMATRDPSGPRWASVAVMAATTLAPARAPPRRSAIPTMAHMSGPGPGRLIGPDRRIRSWRRRGRVRGREHAADGVLVDQGQRRPGERARVFVRPRRGGEENARPLPAESLPHRVRGDLEERGGVDVLVEVHLDVVAREGPPRRPDEIDRHLPKEVPAWVGILAA